jgi:molybdate transport system permease protein
VLSLPLALFLVIPMVALLVRNAPSDVLSAIGTPGVGQAVALSARTSLISVSLIVLLGTPLALIMARSTSRLSRIIDTIVDVPMVLPPAVAGVALLMTFGRTGVLGGALETADVQIPFTQVAVVLAQVFVSAPLYLRAAVIGIASVDPDLEEAALLDGAGTRHILYLVTLPLAAPALFGGAVLAWTRALGEFGATIIFAGNLPGRTQTMPLAIYLGFELDLNVAIALSVVLMCTSFGGLVLVRHFVGRRSQ